MLPHNISLGEYWHDRVCLDGDALALISENERWSQARLRAYAEQCRDQLRRLRLDAGDRVVLILDNGPAFLAMFMACQLDGLIPVPLSPKSSPARLAALARDCGARAAAHAGLSQTSQISITTDNLGLELVSVSSADSHWHEMVPEPALQIDLCQPAFFQYTSGSTGDSKGVVVSHQALLANINEFSAYMELRPGRDVFSSLLPLFHDMGLVCFGLAPLLLGYPLVLYRQEALSLYRWLEGMSVHAVTITGAPDSLLQIANRIIESPQTYPMPSLRMLICGSEPVRLGTVTTFGSRFGVSDAIKPAYGMAELTLCATLTPCSEPLRIDDRGHVASGRALDGVLIRIRHEDSLDDVSNSGDNEMGEILVRSTAVMSGYWQRPAETAQMITQDGFVATGDYGYLDRDGYLYVLGRFKNLLIRAGQKYSPHDMESLALQHHEVRRVGVVQLNSAAAEIVVVLEVDRGLLKQEQMLRQLTATLKKHALSEVGVAADAYWYVAGGVIPTTDNGKIRHAMLRKQIETGQLRAVWSDQSLETLAAESSLC